jgi:HNH endonuclease
VLPVTLAAMRAGDLEPYRAQAITPEVPRLRPEVCAEVEQTLFPGVLRLPTARVRAATRRAVAAADPDEVAEQAKQARAQRFVCVRPSLDPGMTEWVAEQPSETSAAAWAAVDELAHTYVADGEHRSLQQARADAMMDLILGHATVTTTVDLSIPVTALPRIAQAADGGDTGLDHRADGRDGSGGACSCGGISPPAPAEVVLQLPRVGVEIRRIGLLSTGAIAELLADADIRLRAALHDGDTGALVTLGARTYRPGQAEARFVRRRDGCCRFPGCATPAHRSDIDHVTTFATGGPTDRTNLITLCRRHHRLKHHGGWTLTMTPTGVATWTNGIGQHYLTHPVDHRHLAA